MWIDHLPAESDLAAIRIELVDDVGRKPCSYFFDPAYG